MRSKPTAEQFRARRNALGELPTLEDLFNHMGSFCDEIKFKKEDGDTLVASFKYGTKWKAVGVTAGQPYSEFVRVALEAVMEQKIWDDLDAE